MVGDDGVVWYLRTAEDDLGPVLVLVLEGRVSAATAPELARRLAGESRRRAVVVDLAAVDYVNGAGLKVFAAAARDLGSSAGELVVCGLRPVVRTAFELAGPIPHLTIEDSCQAAIHRLLDA